MEGKTCDLIFAGGTAAVAGSAGGKARAQHAGDEKIDRRSKRSREAIRKAFRELLAEKDISQITVTEIARRADRNRKTFYLHYDTIEDLVNELLQEECRHTVDVLEEALRQSSGGANEAKLYEAMSTALLEGLGRNGDMLRHADLPQLIAQMRPLFAQAIAEKDSLGLAKSLGPFLEVFVAYFSSGILGLYSQWVRLDSELPLEYLSKLAMATVGGGVSALMKAADDLHIGELPTGSGV